MAIKNAWRWDQGRLDYFRFENIKSIAQVLTQMNGCAWNAVNDPLRSPLSTQTGLLFAPSSNPKYKIPRNYKRVFECSLLGSDKSGLLEVTDLCKAIANDPFFDPDTYFIFFIKRFRYPFPAFYKDQYGNIDETYPCCAILKYLISNILSGKTSQISPLEVYQLLMENNLTGLEDISRYSTVLIRASSIPDEDVIRQIRELLIFISQVSFLKWQDGVLKLDIQISDEESLREIIEISFPIRTSVTANQINDFLDISNYSERIGVKLPLVMRSDADDLLHTEGKRIITYHQKIERSPTLINEYFKINNPNQIRCDICDLLAKEKYPWVERLIELHHLLPLSSAIKVEYKGTSIQDLAPLCPNCHKSIHIYYRAYLRAIGKKDFDSKAEAKYAYDEGKRNVA